MAINKQPVFTASPILRVTRIPANELNTFDPSSATTNSVDIVTASDSFGTLIERITIHPMVVPGGNGYHVITSKVMYIILYDNGVGKSSILATKKWDTFNMDSTFTEPPYWQLTFEGGIILKENDALYFNQVQSDGSRPNANGDGVTVTVEGSTYSAA